MSIKKHVFLIIMVLSVFDICFADTCPNGKFYVTENGVGTTMSIYEFNGLTGDKPGTCYYFSGPITTRVEPKIRGTSGSPVILDGYALSDCDALNSECTESAVLNQGMYIDSGYDFVTVQDMRMTGGPYSSSIGTSALFEIGNPATSSTNNHFIIRRNFLYNANGKMMGVHRNNSTADSAPYSDDWLIEGNKLKSFSKRVSYEVTALTLYKVTNAVVRENIVNGIDSATCTSCNNITVHYTHNVIFEKNKIMNAPNQAGIAVKEWGNTNLIVRWNYFLNNGGPPDGQGRGIGVNFPWAHHIYVYGNLFDGSGGNDACGMDIFEGIKNVYVWSNVFANHKQRGIYMWHRASTPPAPTDQHLDQIYIYNNTFYNNGTGSSPSNITYTGIYQGDSQATNVFIKNNILAENRKDDPSYHQQIYSNTTSGTSLLSNNAYKSSQTLLWHWDNAPRTLDTMQNSYGQEANGANSDPGLIMVGDNPYALNGVAINNGTDLSGLVGSVSIRGNTYNMYWDEAIDPSNTNFNAIPPVVNMVDQDNYGSGWERGAYVYSGRGDRLIPPKGVGIRIIP